MNKQNSFTRRDFLKTAGLLAGGAVISEALSAKSIQAKTDTSPLLKGVCDIHIHAAPDIKERSIDELQMVKDAQNAGYKAVMFKSNEWSCHDRAYLIRQMIPDFECFGSFCMNHTHGDKINVYAAECAIKTTGNLCRCIWLPTQAAVYPMQKENHPGVGIPITDNGKVIPEVVRIMELCAEADIILASGHCSPEESLLLAEKAKEVGLKKFVVTHANSRIWRLTPDQIKKVIDCGGIIEYCYLPRLFGKDGGLPNFEQQTEKEFLSYVKINPERSFISTDLGQVGMPHPIEGMHRCIKELQQGGLSQKQIDNMVRINPARLIGIN